MLFLFQNRGRHSFWMKNTIIPLDIVFIGDDMTVLDIIERAQPMSYDLLTPTQACRFVLEIAAGEVLRRGISIGDDVVFENVEIVNEGRCVSPDCDDRGTLGAVSYQGLGMVFDVFPVDPSVARVTSLFAAQEEGLRTSPHRGMDFGVPVGTPVRAPWPGLVRSVFFDNGGGGNVVFLDHPNGLRTAYLHLDSFRVTQGQQVKAGDVIALSGNTGRSTGPHLHFEVRQPASPSDVRLNPLDFMPGPVMLSSSLAQKLGTSTLSPTLPPTLSSKGVSALKIGVLLLLGYGAFRLGKQRGWF
jgi:murein DD-endopeptidase MepM/ murein hydrolase activator NlpD